MAKSKKEAKVKAVATPKVTKLSLVRDGAICVRAYVHTHAPRARTCQPRKHTCMRVVRVWAARARPFRLPLLSTFFTT